MDDIRLLQLDLERMIKKRNDICIELGNGYDWMLCDSLIAVDGKIKQAEKKIEELLSN